MELNKKIYCVNLKYRTDRWAEVQEEVKKMGPEYELIRFDAVKNKEQPAIGHADSFVNLLKMAKEEDMDNILIIEDDLLLHPKSKELYEDAFSKLPEEWDILLGGVYYAPTKEKVAEKLFKLNDFCATHFVLFNKKCYDKIIGYKKNNFKRKNLDRFMGHLAKQKKLNCYVVWPMFAKQRAGYSDLRKRKVDDNKARAKKLNFLF